MAIRVRLLVVARGTMALVVVQEILAFTDTASLWPTIIDVTTDLFILYPLYFVATVTITGVVQELVNALTVGSTSVIGAVIDVGTVTLIWHLGEVRIRLAYESK
jgi:hypothetical protein